MPRLTEEERDALMDDMNGHYEQVLLAHPGYEIEPGFGLPQLRALEDDYIARRTAIGSVIDSTLAQKRAERDGIFGTSNEDLNGLWVFLMLYKLNLKARSFPNPKIKKGLLQTVPNLGSVQINTYDAILQKFSDHWKAVNAALPAAEPFVVGTLTLAELDARHAQINALAREIKEIEFTGLGVMRAEREEIFGDVREDSRDDDSIVSRLETYRTGILTRFAGTPLAQTVPHVFPKSDPAKLKFPFNHRQAGSDVIVWFEPPDDLEASLVFLKEGAFEETVAFPFNPPFKVTFSGVSLVEGVDEVELRDSSGKTLAHGKFDGSLIEPI